MKGRFKTDIAHAKGLGSAHSGSHHWLAQRFTSVLLVVLITWMLYIISCTAGLRMSEVIEVVKKPYNVLAISLFAITAFYHATLGMQIIIEDYTQHRMARLTMLYGVKILSIVTAAALVVAMFYLMTL